MGRKRKERCVERFGVSIDPALLREFDIYIKQKGYGTRSEAIRDLIRDVLAEKKTAQKLERSKGKVYAILTIVYNHHLPKLAEKVLEIQHHGADIIISSMHIHIDQENCLEVVAMKGLGRDVLEIIDRISSIKGVRMGKYILLPEDIPS